MPHTACKTSGTTAVSVILSVLRASNIVHGVYGSIAGVTAGDTSDEMKRCEQDRLLAVLTQQALPC